MDRHPAPRVHGNNDKVPGPDILCGSVQRQVRGAERARVAGDELHETSKSVFLRPLV
jgi:hypothetical protein